MMVMEPKVAVLKLPAVLISAQLWLWVFLVSP
jgi:hypothetical protein